MSGRPTNSRPVRVLVLDHTAQLGGAELALVRLVAALDPARVSVRVLLFSDGPLVGRLRQLGVPVRVLRLDERTRTTERSAVLGGPVRTARAAWRVAPFVVRLAREIRASKADVVHATSLKADLLALPAAALARRPLVWHVHDLLTAQYLGARLATVVRALAAVGPHAVVVNSAATAATVPHRAGAVVAPPGLAPEQVRERLPPPRGSAPVVGIVGRISPTKGQDVFLRAAALVAARRPDVRFRIVGAALFAEQGFADEVAALVGRLGLAGRVELAGFVDDPATAMDALDVVVHASPVAEPFGQVVAEAMARGVPVVATRGGGVDEIVEPEGVAPLGRLVPPGDPAALADAVLATLADDGREATARRASAEVAARFPISRTAAVVTEVWERAGGRTCGRTAAVSGESGASTANLAGHGPTIDAPGRVTDRDPSPGRSA
ncbi:MAG TPA: glycosyltransferase [Cellulomonas sp.]